LLTHASLTKQYNLIPANGRLCLVAGKVTVGLASHWSRVTDIGGSPLMGSRPERGRWAPPTLSCRAWLTLPLNRTWSGHGPARALPGPELFIQWHLLSRTKLYNV